LLRHPIGKKEKIPEAMAWPQISILPGENPFLKASLY
jgi:hypothetical protein